MTERFDTMQQLFQQTLTNKIAPTYRKVLLLSSILTLAVEIAILGALIALSIYFNWFQWITIVCYVLLVIAVVYSFLELAFFSKFTVQNWRYHVDKEYIRLKKGKLFLSYQVIPMSKVQFVETTQGPLLRKYQLYQLAIGTMGSEHTIPGLPEEVALALREEISQYAKVKEVEE